MERKPQRLYQRGEPPVFSLAPAVRLIRIELERPNGAWSRHTVAERRAAMAACDFLLGLLQAGPEPPAEAKMPQ